MSNPGIKFAKVEVVKPNKSGLNGNSFGTETLRHGKNIDIEPKEITDLGEDAIIKEPIFVKKTFPSSETLGKIQYAKKRPGNFISKPKVFTPKNDLVKPPVFIGSNFRKMSNRQMLTKEETKRLKIGDINFADVRDLPVAPDSHFDKLEEVATKKIWEKYLKDQAEKDALQKEREEEIERKRIEEIKRKNKQDRADLEYEDSYRGRELSALEIEIEKDHERRRKLGLPIFPISDETQDTLDLEDGTSQNEIDRNLSNFILESEAEHEAGLELLAKLKQEGGEAIKKKKEEERAKKYEESQGIQDSFFDAMGEYEKKVKKGWVNLQTAGEARVAQERYLSEKFAGKKIVTLPEPKVDVSPDEKGDIFFGLKDFFKKSPL